MRVLKVGHVEVYYMPAHKSAYQQAKEEMSKLTVKEINAIVGGAAFIAASTLNQVMAEVNIANFTQRVNDKGNQILALIQIIGYWAAIVFAGIDIVKAFKKQDVAGLIAIACKYAVAVGILYGLPDIFDIFRDLFK